MDVRTHAERGPECQCNGSLYHQPVPLLARQENFRRLSLSLSLSLTLFTHAHTHTHTHTHTNTNTHTQTHPNTQTHRLCCCRMVMVLFPSQCPVFINCLPICSGLMTLALGKLESDKFFFPLYTPHLRFLLSSKVPKEFATKFQSKGSLI